MNTITERKWENIFALAPATLQPLEHEQHSPGECSENCQMAREIKCVCRCGGKNHGAALKRDVKRLDEFNGPNQQRVGDLALDLELSGRLRQ